MCVLSFFCIFDEPQQTKRDEGEEMQTQAALLFLPFLSQLCRFIIDCTFSYYAHSVMGSLLDPQLEGQDLSETNK